MQRRTEQSRAVRGRASFYATIKSRQRPQRAEEAVNISGRRFYIKGQRRKGLFLFRGISDDKRVC